MREGSWDLSELLPEPSKAVVEQRCRQIEERVAAFEAYRAELSDGGPAPDRFGEMVRAFEGITELLTVLGAYGSLWFAADTGSEEALAYRNRIEQRLAEWSNRILFFTLWWKQLDEDVAERLREALLGQRGQGPDAEPKAERQAELVSAVDGFHAHSPAETSSAATRAGDYRHFLDDLRRLRPYTLDEPREQLIVLKDAHGVDALLTVYSMLTNRLQFRLEVEGEERSLSRDALMTHVRSPDPGLREAAYRELFRVYEREAPVLAQIYAHRVHDWFQENVRLRGIGSAMAVRNLANDVPDAAVDTLLAVCREEAPQFQRYFRYKARALAAAGRAEPRLRRYDLYAPLGGADEQIGYGEAVELVLDTFRRFSPRFADLAERVFAGNHVDSELRQGKKGGAFCATVLPSQTPWLLVNYTGRLRDVATLAHELGHAVHSLLAADHSVLTQHAALPLAETASVFAEMLLTERLLAERPDPAGQRELLAAALDDIYATVLRQAGFTLFERQAHAAVLDGASAGELSDLYLVGLTEQLGDSVEMPEEFRLEWVSIPHIYQTPFYCYAYSFGQLLVLALYERYRTEGEAFVPGYLELLAAGGAARPAYILERAGVDISDADFWRGGFRVIERLIDRLDAIP
ncbi:MAG: M3 family oligoendopeptidase [Thermoanaerobaculia bacterium]